MTGIHQDTFGYSQSFKFQVIPDGCQKCFLKWNVARRSICGTIEGFFVDPHRPDDVYKLKRAQYGLKQAPRAWYDRLTAYLTEHGFERGSTDTTIFIRKDKNSFVVA